VLKEGEPNNKKQADTKEADVEAVRVEGVAQDVFFVVCQIVFDLPNNIINILSLIFYY